MGVEIEGREVCSEREMMSCLSCMDLLLGRRGGHEPGEDGGEQGRASVGGGMVSVRGPARGVFLETSCESLPCPKALYSVCSLSCGYAFCHQVSPFPSFRPRFFSFHANRLRAVSRWRCLGSAKDVVLSISLWILWARSFVPLTAC